LFMLMFRALMIMRTIGFLQRCCEISNCTQYKKAPTFAIGCDCSHRQPSERERLWVKKSISAISRADSQYHVAFQTSRGEEADPATLPQTGGRQIWVPSLLDIVLRCYRPFRKARMLSGGL